MRPAVRFDHVSKKFRRGELHDSLRDALAAGVRRLLARSRPSDAARDFWALREVSFAAAPGEALGIIGPNGAGKSTALKLLAGILRADGGRIEVNGRLAALIEVAAGMHGDLTGLENIYLSGAIMGMSRAEIRQKLDRIVAFSGLERFLHTPVKRYSTGMQARLGFATAAHIEPDVLLVDEVLSVGDAVFRQRCEERMAELVREGTALIFVTHNLEQMRKICDRTVVLHQGRVTFTGPPADAVARYLQATMAVDGAVGYSDQPRDEQAAGSVLDLVFRDGDGLAATCLSPREPLEAELRFDLHEAVGRLAVQVALRHPGGGLFVSFNSQQQGRLYDAPAGVSTVRLRIPALPIASGTLFAQVRLWDAGRCRLLTETPFRYTLQIEDRGQTTGMLALPHEWSPLAPEAAPSEATAAELNAVGVG
jgi:lipopolysaccharide transport system ATP-binding protein